MNEINFLALAVSFSNSADYCEALANNEKLSDVKEQLEDARHALRVLSIHLVDCWTSSEK